MRKSFRKKAAAVMMAAAMLFTSVQTELVHMRRGLPIQRCRTYITQKIIVLSMQSRVMNQQF